MYEETLMSKMLALAEELCEMKNSQAIERFEQKQWPHYIEMWKLYRNQPWFDSVYPMPVPDKALVVEIIDTEVIPYPAPVESDQYVCDIPDAPQEPSQPSGNVFWGDLIPWKQWMVPSLEGCRRSTTREGRTSDILIGQVHVCPIDNKSYKLELWGAGIMQAKYWFPTGE